MENLTVIGSVVGGSLSVLVLIGGAIWWCVRRHINHLWSKIRTLEEKRKQLNRKIDRASDRLETERDTSRKAKARLAIQCHRTTTLESQLEESFSEKERLRNQASQLDSQLRKYQAHADRLTQTKNELEQKITGKEAELHRYVKTTSDLGANIKSLQRDLAESRNGAGIHADLAATIQKREDEIAGLLREKRIVEENQQKAQSALETMRLACFEQEKKIESLNDHIEDLVSQVSETGAKLDQRTRDCEEISKTHKSLSDQFENLKDEYSKLSKERLEEPGRIWERPAKKGAPEFVPLTQRSTPIISVINLKGGVGKTTITANLAAMLGLHGKRVLIVDLDFQRSLTILSGADRQKLHREGRALQHFLFASQSGPTLLDCADPIRKAVGCSIVANTEAIEVKLPTDSLEESEMHLQAEWLMNPLGTDVRFLLRKALHSPTVCSKYDYVILDCPPRLSTACINGLAASDFALIPVQLDNISAISAPNLLRKLRQLKVKKVLEHINILGIIANGVRLYKGQPIKIQAEEWNKLPALCKQSWGNEVTRFDTVIKHSNEFAEAADKKTFAAFSQDLKPVFTDLMTEFEKGIRNESSRVVSIPQGVT